MRADRPLLVSAAFLGAGLWMIFRYGISGAGISAALPWSNIGFHLNLAENGPGAIAGVALTALGLLLLIWAILVALASLLFDRDRDDEERDFLRIFPSSSSEPLAESPVVESPVAEIIDDGPSASFSGRRRFL
jgi:hypothetical protein